MLIIKCPTLTITHFTCFHTAFLIELKYVIIISVNKFLACTHGSSSTNPDVVPNLYLFYLFMKNLWKKMLSMKQKSIIGDVHYNPSLLKPFNSFVRNKPKYIFFAENLALHLLSNQLLSVEA